MVRIVLGAVAGLVSWLIGWFCGERILSAIGPSWFGAPQSAFEAALVNDGQFTADTTLLLTHIALGTVISALAGLLAASSAG